MRFAAYQHQHGHRVAVVEEDGTLFPLPGVTSLTALLAETDGLPTCSPQERRHSMCRPGPICPRCGCSPAPAHLGTRLRHL